MSMFAGVDWGGHHHQLAVVDGGGTVVVNRRFMHDRAGIDELLGELRSHGVEPAPSPSSVARASWSKPFRPAATRSSQ